LGGNTDTWVHGNDRQGLERLSRARSVAARHADSTGPHSTSAPCFAPNDVAPRGFVRSGRPALPLRRPPAHHRHPLHPQGRRGAPLPARPSPPAAPPPPACHCPTLVAPGWLRLSSRRDRGLRRWPGLPGAGVSPSARTSSPLTATAPGPPHAASALDPSPRFLPCSSFCVRRVRACLARAPTRTGSAVDAQAQAARAVAAAGSRLATVGEAHADGVPTAQAALCERSAETRARASVGAGAVSTLPRLAARATHAGVEGQGREARPVRGDCPAGSPRRAREERS